MQRATVPEASVYEHRDLGPNERDVRPTPDNGKRYINLVSQAEGVQSLTKSNLTRRVAASRCLHAAAMDSLIGTAKRNGLDPESYLRNVLVRIADHPINRVGELLPWNLAAAIQQQ